MAVDHLLECRDIAVEQGPVGERHLHHQQIGIALGREQVMEEDALLKGRQGVDILDVGGAAGDPGGDAVDIVLAEVDQGEHVRGDARAALGDRVGRDHDLAVATQRGGEVGEDRHCEQRAHIGGEPAAAQPLEQLDRQQRVSAQFEEVVVAADLLDPEQVGPDGGERLLDLAMRRLIDAAREGIALGCRQRLAVELAVGGERQCLQRHISRRHHMIGQVRRQMRAQPRRALGGRGHRRIPGRHHIGHQPLVPARVLAREHHRLAHLAVLDQPRLDLPKLDPEPADLHLIVVAAQELDVAVRQIPRKVPRLVQPVPRHERARHEPLRGQIRPVQIPPRNTRPTYVQLPHRPQRNRHPTAIQHIYTRVRYRTTNGRRAGLIATEFVRR